MSKPARPDNALGQNLRRVRRALRLSQREAAGKIGDNMSAPYLCQIEKGQVKSPSLTVSLAIARAYDLRVEQLAEWVDSPHHERPTCPACGQEMDDAP